MTQRRKFLKNGAAAAAIATLPAWQKPLVNAVVLPAHAQTSTVSVSCSMVISSSSAPLPEGGILFETSPPQPGAAITWRGFCDGAEDFPPISDVLDDEFSAIPGSFELTVFTSFMCSGGPPATGQEITHSLTLDVGGASAECSYFYQP